MDGIEGWVELETARAKQSIPSATDRSAPDNDTDTLVITGHSTRSVDLACYENPNDLDDLIMKQKCKPNKTIPFKKRKISASSSHSGEVDEHEIVKIESEKLKVEQSRLKIKNQTLAIGQHRLQVECNILNVLLQKWCVQSHVELF